MKARLLAVGLAMIVLPYAANASTACQTIADPTKRLACYDDLERRSVLQAQEAAVPAQNAPPPPLANDATLFGVPTQTPNDPLNDIATTQAESVVRDDDGVVESITSPVVEYSVSPARMVTVVLANGQVWRQVSGRELWLKDEATKNVVKISRTLLGGFAMTANGKNDVAIVKRLDGKRTR